jgi:hypothetical protein
LAALVYEHPFDARRRLAELGVSVEAIVKALKAGHLARISCTDNDPPFIPGTEAWRFVVRTLREELLKLGWRKDDPNNFSLVISDKRKINIVVESGDDLTRVFPGNPTTKSLKGLLTEAVILRNSVREDLFPDTITERLRRAATVLEHPTWVLLIYITDEEYRAELSYPDAMDDSKITSWKERIFIPDDPNDPGALMVEGDDGGPDDGGPDFDIPVRRKS